MEEINKVNELDKAIQYFGNIFDKTIERDPENEELFKNLVLTKGTKTIFNLTKFIDYDKSKSKILYNRAFKICMLTILGDSTSVNPLEFAVGCRGPESKGSGYWDQAFIIIKNKSEAIKTFTFYNNKNEIIEYNNMNDAYKIYKQYIRKKWIKMDPEDINKTIGVKINENTLLAYNKKPLRSLLPILLVIPTLIVLRRVSIRLKHK